MDNLFCTGSENVIQDCAFDGWKKHDCGQNEAAGVVCRKNQQNNDINLENDAVLPQLPKLKKEEIVDVVDGENNNKLKVCFLNLLFQIY